MFADYFKHFISFFQKESKPSGNVMLMYHSIRLNSDTRYMIKATRFRDHLKVLCRKTSSDQMF